MPKKNDNGLGKRIERRLAELRPTFARAAIGDFSRDVPIPETDDELTEVFMGVQVMLEVIREQLDEVNDLNAELEDKVEKLKKEVELRAELERRKDEFISLLGHELRNPLTPIVVGIGLIKMKADEEKNADEALRKSISIIERQSNHMSRLIQDLLDTSRILHGKIELRRETVDLRDIVREAVDMSRPLIEERGHRLKVAVMPRKVSVFADQLRLEQIVVNILNNAAKYTDRGGRITVTLRTEVGKAAIAVKDTGIGIDPALHDKVFDMFVQTEAGRKNSGGLGMGLTIARGLARLHGGDVRLRSRGHGRGSEFTVLVPLARRGSTRVESAPAKPQSAPKKRVLVVDDNADAADTVAATLSKLGHEVRIAYEGKAALRLADRFRPDTVLLDLAMPGLDGYEVASRLRRRRWAARTRLVAVTGYGQQADFKRTKRAGFRTHIVKPPTTEDLVKALR